MRYKILIVLLCASLVTVMAMAGCIQPETTINGTVTNHSSGELLKGIEVSIYTYQQPSLEYLPPLGDKIANTTSDEQGRYELRVPADYKNKKVVVFCHDALEGWEVINVSETTEKIDLVFGAPVPIGVPTEKLSIRTDKSEYAEEEVVTFWIENICNETVNLMNGAPWRIQKKTNGEWKNVFVPIGIQVIIPLEPGENMSWSWSQRGQDGNYTGSGTYRVVLEYEGGEVETEFKICKATKLRDIDITLGPKGSDSALYILDLGIVKTVECHFYYSAERNASFYQNIETWQSVVEEAKKTGEYKPFPAEENKIEGGETTEYFLGNTVSPPTQMWYIASNNCSVPIRIYGTVETKI